MADRLYVYSTLSCDQVYTNHKVDAASGVAQAVENIFIAGQANVANKHMYTPLGVATEITAEQHAELKRNDLFNLHVKNGFISVSESKSDPDVVAADHEGRDLSAPLVEQDFAENEKPENIKSNKKSKKK